MAGQEVGNRLKVQSLPHDEGEAVANERLTSATNWFRQQCGAKVKSDAFCDSPIANG
jgi:hypothetical protein